MMTNLEIWLLRKYCFKNNLDTAEIDLKLTYKENKKILSRKVDFKENYVIW